MSVPMEAVGMMLPCSPAGLLHIFHMHEFECCSFVALYIRLNLSKEKQMQSSFKDVCILQYCSNRSASLLPLVVQYNVFKCCIIHDKITEPRTTVYRCGPLIDLCRGPHVRHTGRIKANRITKKSSTYWEGKAGAESLRRIYGISFPDTKQLKEWQHFQVGGVAVAGGWGGCVGGWGRWRRWVGQVEQVGGAGVADGWSG